MSLQIDDTIAALASPPGEGALAVIRVTGKDCKSLITSILSCSYPIARKASLGQYRSRNGELLDELLWTFFPGPRSYTGQDLLELSLHGNPLIVERVLADLMERGVRPAEPGEFTRRAFLNGKMDLSQAEAVMDLIQARTGAALQAAHAQREGSISREMADRCDDLMQLIAYLEAYIDFPEEDLPAEEDSYPVRQLDTLLERLQLLIESQERGRFLREGVHCVLVGEPNAGKSSLLNALLREERALVSPTPGTTRDYISEQIRLGDFCIRFTDTAGLRSRSEDPLEALGMEATRRQLAKADVILWVIDRSAPPPPSSSEWLELLRQRPLLLVLNKSDLSPHEQGIPIPDNIPSVAVSALSGEGLPTLEEALTELIRSQIPPALPEQIVLNTRHAQALREAVKALQLARTAYLNQAAAPELLVKDLQAAMVWFEEVVGRVDHEEILDRLFARFCIGK